MDDAMPLLLYLMPLQDGILVLPSHRRFMSKCMSPLRHTSKLWVRVVLQLIYLSIWYTKRTVAGGIKLASKSLPRHGNE